MYFVPHQNGGKKWETLQRRRWVDRTGCWEKESNRQVNPAGVSGLWRLMCVSVCVHQMGCVEVNWIALSLRCVFVCLQCPLNALICAARVLCLWIGFWLAKWSGLVILGVSEKRVFESHSPLSVWPVGLQVDEGWTGGKWWRSALIGRRYLIGR